MPSPVGPARRTMRERIRRAEHRLKQRHHAVVPSAIARDYESESAARVDETLGQIPILRGEIGGKILDAVVAEVSVEFAVDRELLVIERLLRGVRTLQMDSRDRLAADIGDRLFRNGVEVDGEEHARQCRREQRAQHPVAPRSE